MNTPSAIDILVEALTAVFPYEDPLNHLYEVLAQEQPALSLPKGPLTLKTLHQHSQLLHDHTDIAHDQTFRVNQVIQSCQQIPPTPLPNLPWGF